MSPNEGVLGLFALCIGLFILAYVVSGQWEDE